MIGEGNILIDYDFFLEVGDCKVGNPLLFLGADLGPASSRLNTLTLVPIAFGDINSTRKN